MRTISLLNTINKKNKRTCIHFQVYAAFYCRLSLFQRKHLPCVKVACIGWNEIINDSFHVDQLDTVLKVSLSSYASKLQPRRQNFTRARVHLHIYMWPERFLQSVLHSEPAKRAAELRVRCTGRTALLHSRFCLGAYPLFSFPPCPVPSPPLLSSGPLPFLPFPS